MAYAPEDGAFAAGISILCIFGVPYLCILNCWWSEIEIPSRPRFAASAVTFLFALVGFLLVFFAACGQPYIVVGDWDSGAAAAASDALPAHMRAPVHRSMGYPDSEIWIGPTIVSCWGKNKRACAKHHIFSPVAPPAHQRAQPQREGAMEIWGDTGRYREV